MSEFKQCVNGHHYQGTSCPYCFATGATDAINLNASDLYKSVNIILQLDIAPDGVKRYIRINRKGWNLDLKNQIANHIGCYNNQLPSGIDAKISDIEKMVNTELLKNNIVDMTTSESLLTGDFYLSDRTINSIIPDTLLTQILGRGSKLDLLYQDDSYRGGGVIYDAAMAVNTAASASYGNEDFQKARIEIESKKYLAISLLDNSANVVCLPDRQNYTAIKSVEKFCSEDISILKPGIVRRRHYEVLEEDFTTSNYIKHLTTAAMDNSWSLSFQVSRQNVAVALTTLFEKLSALHQNGLVHCDLKPQNILCLKDGLTPFDPVNVRKGEISAGMTTNFCAPEQILTLPVSPATDIYNLGLIVLSVIDGIVYGKTSNYMIPTGGTQVKNVKLLTESMVYIDYNNANIANKEGIPLWKSFLEKCLAFEQRNRFPTMESFMNEYKRLIELYPLKNVIEFRPHFGTLSAVKLNDEFEPAWFVQ